jgi:lysozyme family protein
MADVDKAIDFVLMQEDPELTGEITQIKADTGGRTRFGVAEKYHSDLTNTGFYDSMSNSTALSIAEEVYEKDYAGPLYLTEIQNQNIANALLSFAVNQGLETAVRIFQRALGVDDDGQMGPKTIMAANNYSSTILLNSLYNMESVYYNRIVALNSSQHVFLAGWINRAKRNCFPSMVA